MRFWYIGIVCCLLGVQREAIGHDLGKSQASSYFYLKQNGGYEYAFNTDTGLQSAQTADQSNEVTGHYMYYDKGVPYMVKYRAGKDGFQPEIIPADKLINENYEQPKVQNFKTPDNGWHIRRAPQQDANASNSRLGQNYIQSPKVSSYSIGQDETFNFVQKALKTMQTQPMHLSFTSDLGEIQHPNGRYTTTLRPPTNVEALIPPVTGTEVQDINNLASNTEPKHPYSFNYNADQSARSETADPLGNVVGSYSYYDEAGYHDMSYKASDDTGFVVLGGNLASNQAPVQQFPSVYSTQQHPHQLPHRRQLYRNNNFNFNNYRILPDSRVLSNAFHERNLDKRSVRTSTATTPRDERNSGKRSLRKFRRYAKW